jgi:DNA mismatch repair ATPase MutS
LIATKIKCRTLFATHYHELTELSQIFSNIKNCNVAVREWAGEVIFLHRILPGGTDKSYGLHVAKLAGIPKTILERSINSYLGGYEVIKVNRVLEDEQLVEQFRTHFNSKFSRN